MDKNVGFFLIIPLSYLKDALFVNYSNFAQMKFFIFGLLPEGKKSKKCTKIAKNLIFSPREVGTDYTFQVEQF